MLIFLLFGVKGKRVLMSARDLHGAEETFQPLLLIFFLNIHREILRTATKVNIGCDCLFK